MSEERGCVARWSSPGRGCGQADFGALVRTLRIEAGLSQRELAARMGTTQSAIARLEASTTHPTLVTLGKLAAAVGHELELHLSPTGAA